MNLLLSTRIEAADIPAVADRLETLSRGSGATVTDAYQLKTCVVEVLNNAVEHAFESGRGLIDLRAWTAGRQLHVEAAYHDPQGGAVDCGSAADPTPEAARGRGWFIIRSWMDEATLERRGERTVVRLAKILSH